MLSRNRTTVCLSLLVLAATGLASAEVDREKLMKPDEMNETAPDTFLAKFQTTQGDFAIEVTRAWAPLGADRFYNLVKNGFYDGVRFFRVLPGFVVQFGINGDPEVSAKWREANIEDDPVVESNLKGHITYAMGGPGTRTTQVFINLEDNTRLDKMGFAPFGKVVEGMEIVEKLFGGYGEGAPSGRGPHQGRIQGEGNAYLEKEFPKLDHVKSATVQQ
jgi:peptidyl-prolyl cis-trans isomerase A (cyclophilin A)